MNNWIKNPIDHTPGRYTRIITALYVICSATFWGPACADHSGSHTRQTLVEALRSGGYNVYFRHAQTDWSQSDHISSAGDWESCDPSRVRQLSESGRQTAKSVGLAMRALGIPVHEILASPYCRAVETATLMNLAPVRTTAEIMNLRVADYFGGRDAVLGTARALLAAPPPAGTNTVLVAHGNVARYATEVYPGEAEAVIFQPDTSGGFKYIGRLTPADWEELAERE